MNHKRIRKAVGAIIYKEDDKESILLIKKSKVMDALDGKPHKIIGYWDFPKGGIKDMENPNIAINRELKEEIGSDKFNIIKQLPFKLKFNFSKKMADKIGYSSQETILFLVEFFGNENDLKIDANEITDKRFFTYSDALNKIGKKESKRILRMIWENLKRN